MPDANVAKKSELSVNKRLARLVNTAFTIGFDLNSSNKRKTTENNPEPGSELDDVNQHPENYVDFSIPFNIYH
jgi:hypothetical protein